MHPRRPTAADQTICRRARVTACLAYAVIAAWCAAGTPSFHVDPGGSDDAPGTREAPFRTLGRAQEAVRAVAPAMDGDIVVALAPGEYRLSRTLELTESDSGRNGHRVLYRSERGLGKARVLGSVPVVGWGRHGEGIWRVDLPEGMTFNTLYEGGRRAWKARFPNYEHHADMPTARGRYLVSVDGSPTSEEGETTGWLTYRPDDAPPVTDVAKMKVALYSVGKCDWMRSIHQVVSVDTEAQRITFKGRFWKGVKARARYFLEDELGFLDAPGEFHLDEAEHTLYYMPLGKGHPDTLGIAAPVVTRLIQLRGTSREQCVENLTFEGIAFEETDGFPKGWWSTQYGRQDGALIWMGNTRNVEFRNCHLRNSGRNGIMMIGHSIGNLVVGCWIEHMALNGVTLSNRFSSPDKKGPTLDRCEQNRIHNCRIHDVGEVHTYAACVNAFNVSHNEVSHCELHDSVRYAVTVRGNTGEQYGPPVCVNTPPAMGNRFHHLRVYRCGQDGGDMGALHCANLNNPGGESINAFEQITVADSRAIPSMHDIGPAGIFLDWPKMSMHQIFRHVHIVRSQSQQVRSNGSDNAASVQAENVSWQPGFREELMQYDSIGLTDEFPAEYGGRPPVLKPLPAPMNVTAAATAYDAVTVRWDAPLHKVGGLPTYAVFRDGEKVGETQARRFTDRLLTERTAYRYRVSATIGDFRPPSVLSTACTVQTPPDLVAPALSGARVMSGAKRVRAVFTETVDAATAAAAANYRFDPPLAVEAATVLTPECVELVVEGIRPDVTYTLSVLNVRDVSAARNAADGSSPVSVGEFDTVVSYPLTRVAPGRLCDASGGGGDAQLHGAAVVEANTGPFGGAALRLDGKGAFAEAPTDLDLGDGDFTIMVWVYRLNSGIILSKGNGFGSVNQWSLGWPHEPDGIALRIKNNFFSTGEGSVPSGRWVHVAFVKRGDTAQAYVNGTPSGAEHDLSALGPLVNDRPLRIGRREHAPDPVFFSGRIAGIVLLRHALSPALIRAHATGRVGE